MAFSFKSLFTSGRSSTLTILPEQVSPEGLLAEESRKSAEAPSEDPLQAALLKEFLAQEFLVQTETPSAPKPVLPEVLEPKLHLEFESKAEPLVGSVGAARAEVAAAPVVASSPVAIPAAVATKTAAPIEVNAPAKVEPAPLLVSDPQKAEETKAATIAVAQSGSLSAELPEAAKPSRTFDIDELLANFGTAKPPQLNQPTGELFEAHAQTVPALADVAPDAYVLKPRVDPNEWALEETLAAHKEWLDSHGASGRRADLRKGDYDSTELISVNLRHADLQDINLTAADLLLADLRDACLVRANFSEACLVGTNFEGANLEGASLENSMGLVSRQIAGANVHEASLPAAVREFRGLRIRAHVRYGCSAFDDDPAEREFPA